VPMIQIFANTLITAAGYLLVAIGFSLIYTTGRFFSIAHGIILTFGAYAMFIFRINFGAPLWLAISNGILISTLLGLAIEATIYRPLRNRHATPATLLIASLGVYVALQAFIAFVLGSGTRTFNIDDPTEGVNLLGARVTPVQIAMVLSAATLLIITDLVLMKSRIGKTVRAVASDPNLAEVFGINCNHVMLFVSGIASLLAGVAAAFLSANYSIYPAMGFRVLLMAMIAVIVGGMRNFYGIAFGAIALSLLQNFTAWWISSRWQDAIAYTVMVLILLLRPQGILGKPIKRVIV
jgi:branched-chain amino acid transport system permease protein